MNRAPAVKPLETMKKAHDQPIKQHEDQCEQ